MSHDGFAGALRRRARERIRKPREPHAEHARALGGGAVPAVDTDAGARAPTSTGSSTASTSCSARAELSAALEEIWQRVRRLNRYVEERAPWTLARDRSAAPASSSVVLASLAEGLRVVTVALAPYMPAKTATLLDALGAPPGGPRDVRAPSAGAARRPRSRRSSPRKRRDRLAHPSRRVRAPDDEELVAAARGGGRARGSSPSAPTRRAAAPRSAPPSASRRSSRRSAATRTTRASSTSGCCASWRSHPRCVAIGETGLDYYRDRAPRDLQRRAFEAQIELADELDKPLVIHTRDAADDTLELLERDAAGLRVILHCFSMPEHLDRCVAPAGGSRSPATSPTPPPPSWRRAPRASPPSALLVETDAPYLTPQSRRGTPERARRRRRDRARSSRRCAASPRTSSRRSSTRNAADLFGW